MIVRKGGCATQRASLAKRYRNKGYMSSLPALSPETLPDDNFIVELLLRQQDLSAVEEFSAYHDAAHDEADPDHEPAQAQYYRSLIPTSKPESGQQYAFEVDLDACSGCKACVVACHTLNGLETDETWRRVGVLETETSERYHVTTACHHCFDPGCLAGCPVKAYDKDPETGIVRHLDDQCIGCQYCTMMCPYDVPQYSHSKGIVRKCDMCHQRLAVGEAPACVQACPNEAIRIQIVDQHPASNASCNEIAPSRCGSANSEVSPVVPTAPSSTLTQPATNFVYRRDDIESALPEDNGLDLPAHSHWPLAIMLVLTQLSVGVLMLERLGTLFGASDIRTSQVLLSIAAVFGLAGPHIAVLHLGRPLFAFRAWLGWKTSWMSREIIVFGGFMGAVTVAAALVWLPEISRISENEMLAKVNGLIPAWVCEIAIWKTLALGIVGSFCSAMIYVATGRQLWRRSRVLGRFAGSTLILGGAATGAVWLTSNDTPMRAAGLLAVLTAVGVFTVKLTWERSILLGQEPSGNTWDDRSRRLAASKLSLLVRLRKTSGLAGATLLLIATLLAFTASTSWMLGSFTMAIALLLVGEIAERLLMFTSVVHDRMPGVLP